MLELQTFQADVLPSIEARWTDREPMPPAVQGDWHMVMRDFTAKQAVEIFGRFIRAHAKARFPRPGEFIQWRKQNGINSARDDDGDQFRYFVDCQNWPEITMVRVSGVHHKKQISRYGWIERRRSGDTLWVWHREPDGGWSLRIASQRAHVSITKIGPAPESWRSCRVPAYGAPDGLDAMLETDEGIRPYGGDPLLPADRRSRMINASYMRATRDEKAETPF